MTFFRTTHKLISNRQTADCFGSNNWLWVVALMFSLIAEPTRADEPFASFDRRIGDFIKEHEVPGVSIAVTNRGRVVFAKGYGFSDVAMGEPVRPESLFRIASISKPITAVAILQLIEQKKLNLDDKVFEVLDFEDDIKAAGDDFETRLRDITIRHLLEHRSGWDRDLSFDAMFQSVRFAEQVGVPAPAEQTVIIKSMLTQKLDFDPGERYAYSNFGYCLLGRVIENLSGQTYEAYVKQNVLAPLGVTTMRIGATRLEGRAENEVRYYHPGNGKSVFEKDLGQDVPHPYGTWNLATVQSSAEKVSS